MQYFADFLNSGIFRMYYLRRCFDSICSCWQNRGCGRMQPVHIAVVTTLLTVYSAFSQTVLAEDKLAWGEARDASLDKLLRDWVESGRIVGAVVHLSIDGRTVYQRALGYADREQGIRVQQNTIFRLASMTKLVTSVATMRLVEQGRLSLDDAVSDWLPYFTPKMKDGRQPRITIRQLMNHSSGLTYSFHGIEDQIYENKGVAQGFDNVSVGLEENIANLATIPLFHEPGSAWRYSMSTDVLGAVVEKVSGMPLEQALHELVTGPLGMTDTTFYVQDRSRLAAAYVDGERQAVRLPIEGGRLPLGEGVPVTLRGALEKDVYHSGGAGMSGTAADYMRLLECLRKGGGEFLSAASVQLLAEHQIGDLRAESEGPGWGFSLSSAVLVDPVAAQSPQSKGTWQWGGVLGSHWFIDPDKRITLVVMTNTSTAGVIGAFPEAIRDTIYGPKPVQAR